MKTYRPQIFDLRPKGDLSAIMEEHEGGRWVSLSELETTKRALRLACERIADSDQTYEEANTSEGWEEVFISRAIHGEG